MTRSDLIEAGQLLFGEEWQSPMARELGVALRTVQRWASGENDPPPGIGAELAPKLVARVPSFEGQAKRCRSLAQKLRG